MDSKKLLLIINPKSGVVAKERIAPMLLQRFAAMGFDVKCVFTEGPGHATDLARAAVADHYEVVVACGGDGTVNETATGLCGTRVPLAIIPSGSGNGLARHLEIPIDEELAAEVVANGCILDCDCGSMNGRKFFCTFGVGFDAAVSYRFAHENRRGRATYIKNVIEEFTSYKPLTYEIEANGKTIEREALIVACCNASQYGNNAFIAPEASVADGLIDIVIVKSGNALRMIQAGADVMAGLVPYNPHIEVIRTSAASIRCASEGYAHIDGEPLKMPPVMEVRCLPKKLRVYMPQKRGKFLPVITPMDYALRDWGIALGKFFK